MESISGNNLIDVQGNTNGNSTHLNTPFGMVKQPTGSLVNSEPTSGQPRFNSNNNGTSMTYNKFGTISGYNASNISTNPNQRASILTKSNTNYFNVTQTHASQINGVVGSSAALTSDAQTLANNRLRAINRSFRTAVDKSFDMPVQSGKMLIVLIFAFLILFLKIFCVSYLQKL